MVNSTSQVLCNQILTKESIQKLHKYSVSLRHLFHVLRYCQKSANLSGHFPRDIWVLRGRTLWRSEPQHQRYELSNEEEWPRVHGGASVLLGTSRFLHPRMYGPGRTKIGPKVTSLLLDEYNVKHLITTIYKPFQWILLQCDHWE